MLTEKQALERAFRAIDELLGNSLPIVPLPEAWPESLHQLAEEHGKKTGDAEAAREEIWVSYTEFLAQRLNRLFDEWGTHGPHCDLGRREGEKCSPGFH